MNITRLYTTLGCAHVAKFRAHPSGFYTWHIQSCLRLLMFPVSYVHCCKPSVLQHGGNTSIITVTNRPIYEVNNGPGLIDPIFKKSNAFNIPKMGLAAPSSLPENRSWPPAPSTKGSLSSQSTIPSVVRQYRRRCNPWCPRCRIDSMSRFHCFLFFQARHGWLAAPSVVYFSSSSSCSYWPQCYIIDSTSKCLQNYCSNTVTAFNMTSLSLRRPIALSPQWQSGLRGR
jgi:hypothetical protein